MNFTMRSKYCDNLQLCYMDIDSLIYPIGTEDFYADIADDGQQDSIHQVTAIDHYP